MMFAEWRHFIIAKQNITWKWLKDVESEVQVTRISIWGIVWEFVWNGVCLEDGGCIVQKNLRFGNLGNVFFEFHGQPVQGVHFLVIRKRNVQRMHTGVERAGLQSARVAKHRGAAMATALFKKLAGLFLLSSFLLDVSYIIMNSERNNNCQKYWHSSCHCGHN